MHRRTFVGWAGGILAPGLLSSSASKAPRVVPGPSEGSGRSPAESGTLDIRGIMALHDFPKPSPGSIWNWYQDLFSFDARKNRRYDGPFWDKDNWEKYLTLWSREGYNTVFWMGPNELMSGDQLLVRFEEFPEARQLTPEESERTIAHVKWLFRRAKELGMKNFLYACFIYWTKAFGIAHGLNKPMPASPTVTPEYSGNTNAGVRNELTRRYTEALIAEICKTYENLDGFYGPMGELVPGDRSTYYKEAVVPGLKRSGRRLLFIVHQWQTPLEDYVKNIAPKEVYENTWLGWHAWNGEQITDPQPYPDLVGWAGTTRLPTVATVWPPNIMWFPFNSPQFAYEMAYEMKRIPNFRGYMYYESGRKLSPLFRKALAYYSQSTEPYSDEPWVMLLEEQFGDREAAAHFLRAYNISGRIIPEKSALVWDPNGFPRGELRLPYVLMTGDTFQFNYAVSPVRTEPLQPIWHYAAWAAKHPKIFKGQNGSDWRTAHGSPLDFHQAVLWRTEGGSAYDIIPPVHMARVRSMGEACLEEAEEGLKTVKKNQEEARQAYSFMKGYKLLATYYERKVAAATAGLIYSHSQAEGDKAEAEKLADEALQSYLEAATFMQRELDPVIQGLYGAPMKEMRGGYLGDPVVDLSGLMEAEREERKKFADIFFEGKERFSKNFIG